MPSTFAIDGIASSLPTQQIIGQLMALERRPLTLLKEQQNRETLKLQSVSAIKSAVSAFQTALNALMLAGKVNAKSATSDTPGILTATAGAGAISGTHKVTVSQLATATSVRSSGPLGQVINKNVALASAGFRLTPVTGTFSINGQSLSVDGTSTLDDGTANSIIAKINAAGASVTASLIADADGRANNRVQLVSNPGQAIQLGSLADTGNVWRLLNLADAAVQGYTASNVTGAAASAGALNTSIAVNGVTTAINQTDGGFSSQQNAAFIVGAINANSANTVSATDNGDGTFKLTHKTLGSQQVIDVTAAGVGTGLSVGQTKNGTDRMLSTANLGVVDLGKQLADSRLVTPISGLDAGGNGKFTINGIEVTYRSTDTISGIVNRINGSGANVTAFYDITQDRIRLTAGKTGGQTISLADTQGNFLAATGVLGTTQTLGQNAVFSIDSVNGGQPLTSSSNTVTDYIPGVTLELKSTSATPATVTVGQDSAAATNLIKTFVDKFNAVLDAVENSTKFDPKTRQQSTLTGDSGVRDLDRQLRSLLSSAGFGLTGKYRSLADLGISTGKVGSSVGTTDRLVLDEAKLTAALQDNPSAAEAVFVAFTASLGAISGPGNITLVSGSPTNEHENGTYKVKVLDTSGAVEVRFVTADGRTLMTKSGTLVAGQDNTSLIPGVKLRANSTFVVGEDSFAMTVSSRGAGVRLSDYLNGLLGEKGFFATREDSVEATQEALSKRVATMEARLAKKEETLNRKFAALEVALTRIQGQNSALLSQLARLSGQQQQ